MPVCYFNQNYETSYNCEYETINDLISVTVDYNIHDEIPSKNGIVIYGNQTFAERDILVIDYKGKSNFLLKDAFYDGHSITLGSPDGTSKTKFKSQIFFKHQDFNKLTELLETPKIKKIKIFSPDIVDLYGLPSLTTTNTEEDYVLKFNKNSSTKSLTINSKNIKSITIGDYWKSMHSHGKYQINIEYTGYIELEFLRRVNYDKINDYISELITFMQLYHPSKFLISKIHVLIDKNYYELFFPYQKIKINEKYIEHSINVNLIDFLSNCYNEISFRNPKTYIRNIPYIITNTSRSIEDNFLMFFKFIECYYKSQNIPGIRTKFITYSLEQNYKKKYSAEETEKLAQQIICLRNHYVHAGYHLKNSSLRISFNKIDGKSNQKNYTENNIDFHWIYERTKILYDIAINIIFINILKYEKYNFTKHF